MGQYQTFILDISAGNYYYEVIFGKDPFLRTLCLKMAPNPIISQIYIFVTSHFGTLYINILTWLRGFWVKKEFFF